MQAVQAFLIEQSQENTGTSTPSSLPMARPQPPILTASPAQVNSTCNYDSVQQYSVQDVRAAHDALSQKGYGNNSDNCCTGQQGACSQLALSGGVAVQMCGSASSGVQCAACANMAIALNVLNIDCARDGKIGGREVIPYLDGVTLEFAPNKVTV